MMHLCLCCAPRAALQFCSTLALPGLLPDLDRYRGMPIRRIVIPLYRFVAA
jgi:hypothetical protein